MSDGLVKVRHRISLVDSFIVAAGGDGEVAEICHERVTFPAEEEFDLHSAEAVRV